MIIKITGTKDECSTVQNLFNELAFSKNIKYLVCSNLFKFNKTQNLFRFYIDIDFDNNFFDNNFYVLLKNINKGGDTI